MDPLAGTAVEYETLPWDISPVAAYVRAAQRQQGNYQAAVSAKIADLTVNLPSDVLADAEDASREVTRFDAELGGEIAPFSSVLLRTESAASSNIENLTASARAIAEAELPGANTTANAKFIVANTAAMIAAINLAGSIDADAILAMHKALMGDVDASSAGTWRGEQVWIGGGTHGPRGAMFVPPHHSRVVAAIDDLLLFAQRDNIPVLPQISLAHAQFETIHPFTDGNGRTGRALIQAMLRHKGLTRNVTVPVSAGLLTDTDSYFAALTAYRDGDPAPIVRRVSEAAVAAVFNGRELVSELHAVRTEWNDKITARRDSAVWQIADLLLRRPVVNTALLTEELGIESKHARRYLEPLSGAGIIIETSSGPRSRVWRSPEVIAALDAFADRARRGGLG
ncbi:Fic family protein [Mycolicibacterium pyrenivorans]|uniref:Fic family protein n=1 Tax=Mycolicibacterium pyrenivorans TaxID=187102 RepID=UPI0021F274CA|nr:Fic family protein [Mycolicibacterium pyrenivorans]MCV7150222.1 Fic family protein [Mycolicibacterium pyrenivorans]